MMRRCCTVILLVLLSIYGYAKGDSASIRHFTIDNGLPSNNVYAVTQDKLGYMWFNTDNGVVKYDGYTFKTFTTADGLPSNDVWKLYPDKRGRLWVSTHANKIGYIKDDKYNVVITSQDKAIHPSYINSDKNNVYFILGQFEHAQLIKVDSNDKVSIIRLDTGKTKALLTKIGFDNTLISIKDDSSIYLQNLSDNSNKGNKQRMDSASWAFIQTGGGGPSHYGGQLINLDVQRNFFLYGNNTIYFDKFGGNRSELIYTYYQDDDSLTIITNAAIYRLSRNMTSWRRIPLPSFLPKTARVGYYYIDNAGNEWYTTTNGVWCVYNLNRALYVDNSLSSLFNMDCIGQLKNGNTYWNTKGSSIIYELDTLKRIRKIISPNNYIPSKIVEKSDSEFYLNTNLIIYVYNNKKGSFKNITDYYRINTVKRYNLSSNVNWEITYSFMGTKDIAKFKKNKWILFASEPTVRTAELRNHTLILTGLDTERIKSMCYDSADNLFILFDLNKISLFFPVTEKYVNITPKQLSDLQINAIQEIVCDGMSNIYILYNGRLIVCNLRLHRLMRLNCNVNLSNALISVYNNYFFIVGKFGIGYVKIKGPISFGEFHVAVNFNNYNRAYNFVINSVGTAYISTDKGIISCSVKSLFSKKPVDPINNNPFSLNVSSPLQKRITNGDTVNILQEIDKVNLNVVNQLGSGNIRYSYRIEGYNDWQQSTTNDILTVGLKSGHYYKIDCRLLDDAWASNEYSFYIYKMPHWWQRTGWVVIFWISGIVLFASAILIAVLLTKRIVARANEKKRVLTELELRAVYAQINPHFIFNTLSATLYFINRKKFDDAYVHVNKFSRLIRGYLKSAQERYITLGEELEMLRNYVELQKARFEEKFDYSIEIDNKLPVNNIKIPSLLLQPLVENAINHGLFHRKEGGKLTLQFLQGATSDELICIIDDNGVGRERAKEIKAASGRQYESYGTKLTKQLIDVFAEFEKMGIILEYTDKQPPETGTIVKLTIKNIKYVA